MDDDAPLQLEHPCVVVPTRNTLRYLQLSAKRMEKSLK